VPGAIAELAEMAVGHRYTGTAYPAHNRAKCPYLELAADSVLEAVVAVLLELELVVGIEQTVGAEDTCLVEGQQEVAVAEPEHPGHIASHSKAVVVLVPPAAAEVLVVLRYPQFRL